MITGVTFRGGETTGGVADRTVETAKQETTGGVGVRKNNDSIFAVDNEPKQDTVCFRGRKQDEGFSTTTKVFGAATVAALAIAGMGYTMRIDPYRIVKSVREKEYFG